MNADLTFNTIVFKKSFDERDGSERRSTARGVNIPDLLTIRQQKYIDSETKVPGTRYTMQAIRVTQDAQIRTIKTIGQFTFQVPSSAESADVTDVVTTFKALVADAGFITAVLNSEK